MDLMGTCQRSRLAKWILSNDLPAFTMEKALGRGEGAISPSTQRPCASIIGALPYSTAQMLGRLLVLRRRSSFYVQLVFALAPPVHYWVLPRQKQHREATPTAARILLLENGLGSRLDYMLER